MIARGDYDARRWRQELGDSREQIASSQSVVVNAVDATFTDPVPAGVSAQPKAGAPTTLNPVGTSATTPAVYQSPASETISKPTPSTNQIATAEKEPVPSSSVPRIGSDPQRTRVIENKPTVQVPVRTSDNGAASSPAGPMDVGSLIAYATRQQAPVYPPAARSMRASGIVKVEVTVSESGEVAEVKNTTGPMMLQSAAKDAIMKWRFKPFMRDGQPVQAVGYVNFNFSL
jgi:protein TonB